MNKSLAHLPQHKAAAAVSTTNPPLASFTKLVPGSNGDTQDEFFAIPRDTLHSIRNTNVYLVPCVKKLHEVTEKICKEKIESLKK